MALFSSVYLLADEQTEPVFGTPLFSAGVFFMEKLMETPYQWFNRHQFSRKLRKNCTRNFIRMAYIPKGCHPQVVYQRFARQPVRSSNVRVTGELVVHVGTKDSQVSSSYAKGFT